MTKSFLFSIDLEDIRNRMPDGSQYEERVPAMMERFLLFLENHNSKATFFTVGDVARAYPQLIKDIAGAGHEIACHSDLHIELHKQSADEFEQDLNKSLEALYACGIDKVIGYRAPVFSLTASSKWAYSVLEKAGVQYSSSVLPAANPLNGWKDFGQKPKRVGSVLEIPISISKGLFKVPFAGGVYFRSLPFSAVRKGFRQHDPIVGYFHAYDIDTEQENFMHPGIGNSWFYNFIITYNRQSTLSRLEKIMEAGYSIKRYDEYAAKFSQPEHRG